MEDSNPQETIADLHVGFLDRCATVTPIFRIVRCPLDYQRQGYPCPVLRSFQQALSFSVSIRQPHIIRARPGLWYRLQGSNLRPSPYQDAALPLSYAGIMQGFHLRGFDEQCCRTSVVAL